MSLLPASGLENWNTQQIHTTNNIHAFGLIFFPHRRICLHVLLKTLYLTSLCVCTGLSVFVRQRKAGISVDEYNCKNPDSKGSLGLLPGQSRQRKIWILLNHNPVGPRRGGEGGGSRLPPYLGRAATSIGPQGDPTPRAPPRPHFTWKCFPSLIFIEFFSDKFPSWAQSNYL